MVLGSSSNEMTYANVPIVMEMAYVHKATTNAQMSYGLGLNYRICKCAYMLKKVFVALKPSAYEKKKF